MKQFLLNVRLLFLILLLFQTKVFCQTYHVSGRVLTDSQYVNHASVVLYNSQTNSVVDSTTTDSLGYYQLNAIVGVANGKPTLPTNFELAQNYPNPFSNQTEILYKLNKQNEVTIKIYDILGREIKTFRQGEQNIGIHGVVWNGTNNHGIKAVPGIYFYQLITYKEIQTMKMVYSPNGSSFVKSGNQFPISNPRLRLTNETNTVWNRYTFEIKNIDTTKPEIVIQRFEDIEIRNDTTINFLVKKVNSELVLCYNKVENDNWNIFLNNIQTANPKNISTDTINNDSDPFWSPDGKYILYTHAGYDIYKYDVGSGSTINLTPGNDFNASEPYMSPDSKKIIYHYFQSGSDFTYIMNSDGTENRKLLNFSTKLYFYNNSYDFIYRDGNAVYKSDVENTYNTLLLDLTTISSSVSIYDFNPIDNELLLTLSETPSLPNIIAKYNFDEQRLDTVFITASNQLCFRPKFSNDFLKIAFVEVQYDSMVYKISVIIDSSKNELVELTNKNEWIDFRPLAFSNDDKYLAYSKNINKPGPIVSWVSHIYVIDLETKQEIFIDEGINASWKP